MSLGQVSANPSIFSQELVSIKDKRNGWQYSSDQHIFQDCALKEIKEGDILAAPYLMDGTHSNRYYRARVEEVLDDGRCLDLYYLDYGDNDQVAVDRCYVLW